MLLQGVPLRGRYGVAAKVDTAVVGVAQAVIAAAPVVGQQNHAIHVVHLGLGKSDA